MKISAAAKQRKNKKESSLINIRAAGRPKKRNLGYIPHQKRPAIAKGAPVHITLKRSRGYHNLRNTEFVKIIKEAVKNARHKGLRIIYFTLQHDHIHLFIEALAVEDLKIGMKAFTSTVLYFLRLKNRLIKGLSFFKDRYHLVIKKTLNEVKRLVCYILFNSVKHSGKLEYDEDYTFSFKRKNRYDISLDPPQFWLSKTQSA
jgi:REP element-mobilizing transposase RayT